MHDWVLPTPCVDDHKGDVIGLRTPIAVSGPGKDLLKQTFRQLLSGKVLVSVDEVAQAGLSELPQLRTGPALRDRVPSLIRR